MYQIEEERRLLYVAITRAEVNCVITYATSRYHNGQTKTCVMSRFLRDISPDYLLMGSTNSAPAPSRKRPRWDDDDYVTPSRTTRLSSNSGQSSRPTVPTRPVTPLSRPVTPTTPSPSGGGNFAVHAVDELHEGSEILHQRFGHGTVISIDTSGGDPKVDVRFNDGQTRKLLLKFAKFEIL